MTNILTISGWAQHPSLLSNNINLASDYYNYLIHKEINYNYFNNQYDLIIGWSQGGHIAIKIAAKLNIPKIILIATPYEYLHETHSVKRSFYQKIINDFKHNPKIFLTNFQKFICAGDKKFKSIINKLDNYQFYSEDLLFWLKKLPEIPNVTLKQHQEIMYIYGTNDQIISNIQGKKFATIHKNVKLIYFKEAAHAPFLSDNIKFNKLINDFRIN